MQGEVFGFDIRLMKVGGCDLVLGIDWIDVIAPMVINTRPYSISFIQGNRIVTLVGFPDSQAMAQIDTRLISRLLNRGGCNWVAQTYQMEVSGPHEEIILSSVEDILLENAEVFLEPTKLPPIRSCDHAIKLIPGSTPVNQRPYRYSHEQKDVIEKMVQEMLKAKTVKYSTSPFASPVILVKKKDST